MRLPVRRCAEWEIADSGRAHGVWNLPVAYCLGVWGIAGVERIRCADDGVSGVVGGYRIAGAYGLLVVYPEKEIGFELKRKRLSQILRQPLCYTKG